MKRRRNCGIYKILNRNNGKFYIGSAVNLSTRWREHVWQLERGRHGNRHLQSAWKKHGAEAFVFEVLEHIECDSRLILREQFYLDQFRPFDPKTGYNISPVAGSTLGVPCSPEKGAKIGAANRGKVRSEEHRAILRKHGGIVSWTDESRRKVGEANIRRGAMTPELIRMGIEARRGKSLSAEHKAKQSAALKANTAHHEHLRALNDKTRGKSTILTEEQIEQILAERIAGATYVDLGKKYGVSDMCIRNWCIRRGVSTVAKPSTLPTSPEPVPDPAAEPDLNQLSLL